MVRNRKRKNPHLPEIKFGQPLDQLDAFNKCFAALPDLLDLESLDASGQISFEGVVTLKGRVELKGINKPILIENGRQLINESIEG